MENNVGVKSNKKRKNLEKKLALEVIGGGSRQIFRSDDLGKKTEELEAEGEEEDTSTNTAGTVIEENIRKQKMKNSGDLSEKDFG